MKNIIIVALLSTVQCSKTIDADLDVRNEILAKIQCIENAIIPETDETIDKIDEAISEIDKEKNELDQTLKKINNKLEQINNRLEKTINRIDAMQHKPLTLYSFFIEPWVALYTFLRSR